jgi:RNA polymerase sigma-70 factor (ECF subfamily)
MEEKKLVERLRKKDREAQKYVYEKYSKIFYGLCLRYAYNAQEADDMLQEGFLKIFLKISQYSGTGSFEGWMKRIIINNAINFYHKYYKYRYHDNISESYDLESDDNFYDDADFTYDELLGIINELPAGYKIVFNLFAIEGYKHKEISKMLGISENTSKSQYHRAKKILQNKLKLLKKHRNEKYS